MSYRQRSTRRVVLARHPLALIPGYTLIGLIAGSLTWLSDALGQPIGLVVVAIGTLVATVHHSLTWWSFRITVQAEYVQVQSLNGGLIQRTIYPIPALTSIAYEQNLLEAPFDTGSLVLHTTQHRLRYGFLTPFSMLEALR